jgi:curved DNA-binding protein CbpA
LASHYETLGISPDATPAEIKSAYRKIALAHHPDRSPTPRSHQIFREATEAYEVISDRERRESYDAARRQVERLREERIQRERVEPKAQNYRRSDGVRVTEDVQRLVRLYAQRRLGLAEQLARQIRRNDPRQPIPYAILGDIARSAGNLDEAAKMYAYAAQFEPNNAVYQRRYEELLAATVVRSPEGQRMRMDGLAERPVALGIGVFAVLSAAIVGSFGGSSPTLRQLPLISSWSGILLLMLFLAGLSAGVALCLGNYLDSFGASATTATGRTGPALMLGAVALVSFLAAVALYVIVGASQKAFDRTATRLLIGASAAVLMFTMLAEFSRSVHPGQVLLWSGNLIYVGVIVGWMVADSIRAEMS